MFEKKSLHVLFVIQYFYVMGGSVTRNMGLLKDLYKYNIDASILTTSVSKEVYASLKVANLSRKTYIAKTRCLSGFYKKIPSGFNVLYLVSMIVACLKYLKHNKCDLIYVRPHPEDMLACLFISLAKKKPLILELHHPLESLERFTSLQIFIRKIVNLMISKVSKIVVNSQTFRKELMLIYGENISKKVCVVANGVNVKLFDYNSDHPSNPLLPLEPIIGFIGSLKPDEDLLCLTKAAKLVLKRYPKALFKIVGEDLGLKRELEKEIERLALKERFLLIEKKPYKEIPGILKGLSVFAAPRVSNEHTKFAIPIKLLEAMSAGVPIVATSLPPIVELVGDAAILVPPSDYVSLARGIVTLLEDSRVRNELVRKAYERAIKFDWENITSGFVNVLRETYSA